MTAEQTAWMVATAVALLVAELVFGRHRRIYQRTDHLVNGLCTLIGMAITRPLAALMVAFGRGLLPPESQGFLSHWGMLPSLAVTIATAEFCCYWVHRLAHAAKDSRHFDWLWRLHRTHHSESYVNVVLVFRVNPFWPFVMPLPWVAGFFAYAGQTEAAALAIFMFSMWGLVTHSHFRWDDALRRRPAFGPAFRAVEHVIVSPGIHHSHHGYGKDGGNFRNYGIMLSIFDTLFGSLHIPSGRPFRYGLPGKQADWREEIFFPFYRHRRIAEVNLKSPKNNAIWARETDL